MSAERHRRTQELFHAALDVAPERRGAWLADACGDDAELRASVEALLAADATADVLLDGSPLDVREHDDRDDHDEEPLPERIGPFRVVRRIGSGGSGVVYEAEQDNPRRSVAVKLLRTPFATRSQRARFDREAQVLGRLSHPGIAQVIAAGEAEIGGVSQPFVAMQLIRGAPLTEWADRTGADLRRRLELLADVCDAVDHAHRHGVVHRDLKPGNVLVGEDGGPVVLDFGIARDTAGGSTTATLRTSPGEILGTLDYMSPEQAGGDSGAVDARADVYSLGAILYELAAGRPPHHLAGKGIAEALRLVRESDPLPPSRVVRALPADVDAITAKALEHRPAQRYSSAADLADDLRRHLADRPIVARPPSALDRASKFVRRNPVISALSALVFLLLAGGLAWTWRKSDELRAKSDETEAALARVTRLSDVQRLSDLERGAEQLYPAVPARAPELSAWLADARRLLERLALHERTLAAMRATAAADGGAYRFATVEEQWEHDVLARLVDDLHRFADQKDGTVADVTARLSEASTIEARSLRDPDAAAAWQRAIAAVATNARYGGLALAPQLGLHPLGADPDSGLEEFLHLPTHIGAIPRRADAPSGRIAPTPDLGVVFVLVPGGRFAMGAQATDPSAPGFEPGGQWNEVPVQEVALDAYFIAKFECTQSQWLRAARDNPSFLPIGRGSSRTAVTGTHPVEQVDWNAADRWCRHLGLLLPTEAQWEFACRAGTRTAFWTGADAASLQGAENIADEGSKRFWTPGWVFEPGIDDGFDIHAPVGSFRANAFGLHDLHGNVAEWCRDEYPDYKIVPRVGDGLRDTGGTAANATARGGGFQSVAAQSRSAQRGGYAKNLIDQSIGFRPARALDR